MPTPLVLDIDALLAPVSDAAPAGADLRQDASPASLYYRIKDARSRARAAERQLATGDTTAEPDWSDVLEFGPEILARHSKDLEVTAYLIEALVREHVQRLIQALLEEEVTAFLGRPKSRRRAAIWASPNPRTSGRGTSSVSVSATRFATRCPNCRVICTSRWSIGTVITICRAIMNCSCSRGFRSC